MCDLIPVMKTLDVGEVLKQRERKGRSWVYHSPARELHKKTKPESFSPETVYEIKYAYFWLNVLYAHISVSTYIYTHDCGTPTAPLKNQGLNQRQKWEIHSLCPTSLYNNTQDVTNLKLGLVPEFGQ